MKRLILTLVMLLGLGMTNISTATAQVAVPQEAPAAIDGQLVFPSGDNASIAVGSGTNQLYKRAAYWQFVWGSWKSSFDPSLAWTTAAVQVDGDFVSDKDGKSEADVVRLILGFTKKLGNWTFGLDVGKNFDISSSEDKKGRREQDGWNYTFHLGYWDGPWGVNSFVDYSEEDSIRYSFTEVSRVLGTLWSVMDTKALFGIEAVWGGVVERPLDSYFLGMEFGFPKLSKGTQTVGFGYPTVKIFGGVGDDGRPAWRTDLKLLELRF